MHLPDDCIRLASPPATPAIVPQEDLGVRSAKFAAWGASAVAVVVAVRTCDIKVRDAANAGAQ